MRKSPVKSDKLFNSRLSLEIMEMDLQIWHPESIGGSQRLRIDGLRDEIDGSLVGRQVALWGTGKTDSTIDDDATVALDQLA